MESLNIAPDVLDAVPEEILEVTYDLCPPLVCGTELTPTNVKDKPVLKWTAEEKSYYLVLMADPYRPCRKNQKTRGWHHWLVGNIPGNQVSEGETLSEYIGAAPPKNTGHHRYVLLVFKQPCRLSFNERRLGNKCFGGRSGFSIRRFAKKYHLGNPVAGNFFLAKWDTYVPKIVKHWW